MERAVRTIYLVRQIQLHAYERMNLALEPFGLSAGQYTIMSLLNHRDGLSAAQLARRFGVTPQSINPLVSGLEEKGLISRSEAPENRRILKTTLTAAGARLLAACDAAIDATEAGMFRDLNRTELTQLRRLLLKVAVTLRDDVALPA